MSAGIVLIMAIGVLLLTARREGAEPAAWALLVCSIALAGSLLIGGAAAWCGRAHDRWAAFECWRASHLWLNGPWLCMPGCAIIVMLAAAADNWLADRGGGTMLIAMIGLLCWLVWIVYCTARWWRAWCHTAKELALRSDRSALLAWSAALIVLLGTVPLGFVGGTLATLSALDWMGLGPGF